MFYDGAWSDFQPGDSDRGVSGYRGCGSRQGPLIRTSPLCHLGGDPPRVVCSRSTSLKPELNGSPPGGVLVSEVRYSGTIESGTGTGTFEELFQLEHARLFGTLCLATGDRWEAEELMQESFLKVWERWDRVRGHPDPAGYLYRTAFNLHRSRLRRVARAARRTVAVPPRADPFSRVEERHSLFAALRTAATADRAGDARSPGPDVGGGRPPAGHPRGDGKGSRFAGPGNPPRSDGGGPWLI